MSHLVVEDVAPSTEPRRRPPRGLAEAWLYVISAVGAAIATVFSLRLWRADLHVPFLYWGDALAIGDHFKTTMQTGWYEYQPLLGAPWGQHYHDFPTADNLNFAAAHVLGWFTSEWAVAMNVYYIIGFVLAAVTMVWFLREVRVSKPFTVVMSVLFAIAPYHFLRNEGHLWLASYYCIPLALVVVVRAARGERLWGVRPGVNRILGVVSGRGASTFLSVALLATSSTYYGVFLVILLATAGVVAWWRDRDWRRFVGAAVAGVVLVATVLANMAPDILFEWQNGANAEGLTRSPAQVEIYALKLAQLLLPVPGHRIPILAHLRAVYDTEYPLVSESPSLGVVAAFGLVVVLVVVLVQLGGRRRAAAKALGATEEWRTRTITDLSLLTLVAFLCSTVGGLATLLSFVTSSLRGWNRMSIVIGAMCLAVTALVLDAWIARLVRALRLRRTPARLVAVVVALAVLGVGAFDQVTPGATPDYATSKVEFNNDSVWFARVQSLVPAGSMVFQLPYAGFPETPPVNGVYDSDKLIPFLHTTTIRWSGGGIKGRSKSDWGEVIAGQPAPAMVTDLAAAGFAAILVDRKALGTTAPAVEGPLAHEAGAAIAVSADGRYALYSLSQATADLEARNSKADIATVGAAVVGPVLAYPGPGVRILQDPAGVAYQTRTNVGTVTIDNGRATSVRVRIRASVKSTDGASQAVIDIAGTSVQIDLTNGVGQLDEVVQVAGGQNPLTVRASPAGSVTLVAVTATDTDLPVLVR